MEMNLSEIRKKGIETLNDALGPVGMARFFTPIRIWHWRLYQRA